MPVLPQAVVVHPLVLLSVVDHFNRAAKDTKKRVVGVLLGEWSKGKVEITNSYAVPFEEEPKEPNIWFLDHNYHENMFGMFKKVNAREQVVGWYSTGPRIRPADIDINELFRRYCPQPVLVIISVQPKDDMGIPTEAYCSVEEASTDGSVNKTFVHIPSEIGALEAEEVGVEHLLRDIKDTTVSSLANQVTEKVSALKGLIGKLREMKEYLELVVAGRLPTNAQIIYNMQDIFNLLPNLNVREMVQAFAVKTNDMMLVIYLSSMIRSIIALHNLINNKIQNKELERASSKPATAKKEDASSNEKVTEQKDKADTKSNVKPKP